ncbi:MAG: ABC transporter permease, partial [Anaerolineae bacterium]
MVKPWLVIKHEYGTMVRKRSFLLSTLGVPALIVVIMAISIFFASGSSDERPLGYVDQSGVISAQPQVAASQDQPVAIMPFADEQAARDALAAGTIQGFYLLPADYQQTGQVTLYYGQDLPGQDVRDSFDVFLRTNLAAGQAPDVRQRLVSGVDVTVRSADGRREFSEAGVLNILLPFAAGFFFIYAVLASSGYLLQAVTAEKENRTVEIMATSLSPLQLIGGKALGLMAVALTQLLVWAVALVIGLVAAAQFF